MFRSRALTTIALAGAVSATAAAVATPVAASTDVPPTDALSSPAPSIEGEGFASPEDAVSAYMMAMSTGDLHGAIATFAVETYVANYDFEAVAELMGFYLSYNGLPPLPPDDPLNTALNVELRRSEVVRQILNQYFALVNPGLNGPQGEPVEDAAEFTESMSSAMASDALAGLADFEFVALEDIDPETAEMYAGEEVAQQQAERGAAFGIDESQAVAVETSVDGVGVTLLFDVARYGETWWLETLGGRFAILENVDNINAGVSRDDAEETASSDDVEEDDDDDDVENT